MGAARTKTMPRGDCTFRQRDLEAAIKAAEKAGRRVARVSIDRQGKIVMELDNDRRGAYQEGQQEPPAEEQTSWDSHLSKLGY